MISLTTVEEQYLLAMVKFLTTSSGTKNDFDFEEPIYKGNIEGKLIFISFSKRRNEEAYLYLDPYTFEIYGCFTKSSSIGFYLGKLEYEVHYGEELYELNSKHKMENINPFGRQH